MRSASLASLWSWSEVGTEDLPVAELQRSRPSLQTATMKDKPAGMLVTNPIIPIFSTPLSRLLEAGGHEAGGGPTRIQLLWPGRRKLPGCLPSLPPPVHSTSVGVPLAEVGVLSHTAVKADVAPLTRLHRSGPRHAKERRRRRQCQVSSKDRSSSHLGVGCPLGKGMRENR